MNYTQPDLPSYEDKPEDWLASSLLFSRTIAFLLRESEGIVVGLEGDTKNLLKWASVESGKVIVYKKQEMIHVMECKQDYEEGQLIWVC